VLSVVNVIGKPYEIEYDQHIINLLFREKRLKYTELKHALENKVNKEISDDTFEYHRKKLLENNFIKLIRIEGKRGTTKYYSLTDYAKQGIRLRLIKPDKLNREGIRIDQYQDKRFIIIFVIMCNLATKGEHLVLDIDNSEKEGITAREISELYGGSLGFKNLRISEEDVLEVMNLLFNEGIIQKCKKSDDSDRFFISIKNLDEFMNAVVDIFENRIYPRFILRWKNIQSPQPSERLFFQIHYGDKVNQKILHFQNILRQNKRKETFKKDLKLWKFRNDQWDLDLKKELDQISHKYSELSKKHPMLYNIISEVFCPHFLKCDIDKIENKYKSPEDLKLRIKDWYDSNTNKKRKNFSIYGPLI
jgi:DNA-binding transcriptional ArsR family regulator